MTTGNCIAEQHTGTVKWFNEKKGYGFITAVENNADHFVHYSNIESEGYKTLKEGQRVHYTLVTGTRGTQATHVIIG